MLLAFHTPLQSFNWTKTPKCLKKGPKSLSNHPHQHHKKGRSAKAPLSPHKNNHCIYLYCSVTFSEVPQIDTMSHPWGIWYDKRGSWSHNWSFWCHIRGFRCHIQDIWCYRMSSSRDNRGLWYDRRASGTI